MTTLFAEPDFGDTAADVAAISFIVWGRPQQRGSKQASLIPKRGGGFVMKNGRPIVVARDMNKNSGEWMDQVRHAGRQAYQGELLQGPLRLSVRFFFKRLKGHYNSKGVVKPAAPVYHCGTPDLDKLVRSIGDSLTGVVIGDDKQICCFGTVEKLWTAEAERAEISIERVAENDPRYRDILHPKASVSP